LTSSSDQTAKLWDIAAGKADKTFAGHTSVVTAVAFSPACPEDPEGGKTVLTGSDDKTAKLWDIASGKADKTFAGHTSYVTAVAFSPDGKKALTGSRDNTAKLWDIASGKADKTFTGHTNYVTAVAFSPDGKKALTGSYDNTAKLWNIATDAIEDRVYVFSLYEMAKAGLQIEPEDTPQYITDSTAFMDKTGRDSIEYEQLMAAWGNSPEYAAHLKKIADWENSDEYKQHNAAIEKAQNTEGGEDVVQDIVQLLQDSITNTLDTVTQYRLYGVLIDTLKMRLKKSGGDLASPLDYAAILTNAYNSHAWRGFFLKKFEESENDVRAGLAIDSLNLSLNTNFAPALLLQGKFKAAKAEYLKWKNQAYTSEFPTYKDAFLNDLNTFEKAGIIPKEREKDVATIKKLLEKRE
jgi:WD domain, G-beta repeat